MLSWHSFVDDLLTALANRYKVWIQMDLPLLLLLVEEATKRDLASRIDCTDCSLNDLSEENGVTRQEVSLLRGEMETFDVNIQSVREVIESMETRIHNMQGNEDAINTKVKRLVDVAQLIEQRRSQDILQGGPSTSSQAALGHPQISRSSRTLSMPPVLSLEPPISNGSSLDIQEISHAVNAVMSNPNISSGNGNRSPLSEGASGSTVGGFFGRKLISTNIAFISRTRSTTVL